MRKKNVCTTCSSSNRCLKWDCPLPPAVLRIRNEAAGDPCKQISLRTLLNPDFVGTEAKEASYAVTVFNSKEGSMCFIFLWFFMPQNAGCLLSIMHTLQTASNKKYWKFLAQAVKQSSPPGRASRAGLIFLFFYQRKKESMVLNNRVKALRSKCVIQNIYLFSQYCDYSLPTSVCFYFV